eukprot:jgi/Botrbrau1/20490/Bobra.145_2s0049.2
MDTRVTRGLSHEAAELWAPAVIDLSAAADGPRRDVFRLAPQEVQALCLQHRLSEEELLLALIAPASTFARPFISSFHVGAVGIGGSGAVYVGVNLEFARLPLYNSVHAEQFLVVNAVHHGEREITKLAVSAAPCGHCRQFYCELNCADTVQFLFNGGTYTLAELLPERFKPSDLLEDASTPLLLLPQDNSIRLTPESAAEVEGWGEGSEGGRAAAAALEAAEQSYAPYSRCPAGLAIVTAGGGVYCGPYLESAAFNPSLPPLQTAIVDAVIDGMPTYSEVTQVVLVELKEAPVQHALATNIVLQQIAPHAVLHVLTATTDRWG